MSIDGQQRSTPEAPDLTNRRVELAPPTPLARGLVWLMVGLAGALVFAVMSLVGSFSATVDTGGSVPVAMVVFFWIVAVGLLGGAVANVVVAIQARRAHRRSRANWIVGLIPLLLVGLPLVAAAATWLRVHL